MVEPGCCRRLGVAQIRPIDKADIVIRDSRVGLCVMGGEREWAFDVITRLLGRGVSALNDL